MNNSFLGRQVFYLNRTYSKASPYDEGLAWIKVKKLVDAGKVSIDSAGFAVKGELAKANTKEGRASQERKPNKHASNRSRQALEKEDSDDDLPIGVSILGRGYHSWPWRKTKRELQGERKDRSGRAKMEEGGELQGKEGVQQNVLGHKRKGPGGEGTGSESTVVTAVSTV
jgi:hypothetical protein